MWGPCRALFRFAILGRVTRREIKSWLMDMDGVLVHEENAIPGADRFLAALRESGTPFLVLTNNSIYTRRDLAARLRSSGLDVPEEAIWTSALATARFLEEQRPGGSAFVIGEAGLTTALHAAGYTLTDRDADYVVLGETRTYSFERITRAIRLITEGARFIATNPDATGPSPDGPLPATGSVAALISRATGAEPYYVGKPNPLMMRSALNAIEAHSETTAMIGDRMDTDVVSGPGGGPAHDPRAHRPDHPRGGRALPLPRLADRRLGRRPRRRGLRPRLTRDGAADLRRRRRAQLGEAHAAPERGAHAQHGRAAQRPAQAVLHGGDVAEAQRAHAMRRRVVEQPQQPPVGDREQRLRARPRRGGRDQRDVLVALERREQLAPERAAQRAPRARRRRRAGRAATSRPPPRRPAAPPSGPRARRPSARRAGGRRRR